MADTPTGEFVFQAIEDLSLTFVARMPTFPHSEDIEEWAYHATVHFFFCKSFKTYQAMRILCRLGFLEDANVLARTIFELSLQARWVQADPKPRARQFAEHDPVRRYSWYLRAKEIPKLKAQTDWLEAQTGKLAELEDQYLELAQKFLKPGKKTVEKPDDTVTNWWGHSIYWLAKKLGAEDEYATIYWLQSDFVHTSTTSFKNYLKHTEDGWEANCFPTPGKEFTKLAYWASRWLAIIIRILNVAWNLRMEDRISEAESIVKTVIRD